MKEILFRGKTEKGEWLEGWFVGKVNKTIFSLAEDSAQIIDDDLYWHEVVPETVGQYTGLTDKNGKKIFEGDIVKHYNDRKFPQSYQKGAIFYNDESLRWKRTFKNISCCLGNDCIYEVIGNIYDNPELLKEGEQS